jgi:hypothetical protein
MDEYKITPTRGVDDDEGGRSSPDTPAAAGYGVLKAFGTHLTFVCTAAAIGAVIGFLFPWSGTPFYFLPVAAVGVTLGFRRRLRNALASRPWTIVALLLPATAWLGYQLSHADVYAWPLGVEMAFTGSGYCGDFACAQQVFVTMPFVWSLAYASGVMIGASFHGWLQRSSGVLMVFIALFTVSWLSLSWWTHQSLFLAQLSPQERDGAPPQDTDWCIVAAKDSFGTLPVSAQRAQAGRFFDDVLLNLARRDYFDVSSSREAFIDVSISGPVVPYNDKSGKVWRYRAFWTEVRVRRDLPRLTRDAWLIALPLTPVVAGSISFARKRRRR